ncbi:MAG: hypothetical protein V7722_05660 [Porticoccus sp.]
MSTNPSLETFISAVKLDFEFLSKQFSFVEIGAYENGNPFSIVYENKTTRVVVEGRNYGFGVQVMLSPAGNSEYDNLMPLWALALSKSAQHKLPSGQLKQLQYYSGLLRNYAEDELKGDFSSLSRVRAIIDEEFKKSQLPKKRYLP